MKGSIFQIVSIIRPNPAAALRLRPVMQIQSFGLFFSWLLYNSHQKTQQSFLSTLLFTPSRFPFPLTLAHNLLIRVTTIFMSHKCLMAQIVYFRAIFLNYRNISKYETENLDWRHHNETGRR
ncbi:MAG: hypothetical protein IKW77_11270, partial [Salinivirgaceae bacterium]|nr:hypothetical protein [Salinivirgaceae bacterium]